MRGRAAREPRAAPWRCQDASGRWRSGFELNKGKDGDEDRLNDGRDEREMRARGGEKGRKEKRGVGFSRLRPPRANVLINIYVGFLALSATKPSPENRGTGDEGGGIGRTPKSMAERRRRTTYDRGSKVERRRQIQKPREGGREEIEDRR